VTLAEMLESGVTPSSDADPMSPLD